MVGGTGSIMGNIRSEISALDYQISLGQNLKRLFADTLEKKASSAAILIKYNDRGQTRIAIGVPYSISRNKLEIPLDAITNFKRIELSKK